MKTEYKVVPAPERAPKIRGLKGPALFARAMEDLMNEMGAEGWSYLRTDTLPQEERSGLTNKVTTYRNLLVFHRIVAEDTVEQPEAVAIVEPEPTPEPEPESEPDADEVTNLWQPTADEPEDAPKPLVADRQSQRVDL